MSSLSYLLSHQVRAFLQPPMDGIVLETYGSGNAPDNRADLLDEIRKATQRGVIMINCTQCLRGSVTTSYATGQVWVFAWERPHVGVFQECVILSYSLSGSEWCRFGRWVWYDPRSCSFKTLLCAGKTKPQHRREEKGMQKCLLKLNRNHIWHTRGKNVLKSNS